MNLLNGFSYGDRIIKQFNIRKFNGHDELFIYESKGQPISFTISRLLSAIVKHPELDIKPEIFNNLTNGDRSRILLSIRAYSIGDIINSEISCQHCNNRFFFDISIKELLNSTKIDNNTSEQLDPITDMVFHFSCPFCGDQISSAFDIEHFIYEELLTLSPNLEQEIHRLASQYHWELDTILSMPIYRRKQFFELIGVL